MSAKKSYWYAGAAIFLWSTTYALNSLLVDSMKPIVAATYLYICAAVFLLFFAACKVRPLHSALIKKELPVMILLGILGTFSYNLMGMEALKFLGAQQCSVINYMWPVFVVVLSCIFLKQRFTGWTAAALIFSMVGVVLVVGIGTPDNVEKNTGIGVLLSVGGAFLYALFCVWNTRIKTDKFVAMAVYYITAAVLSLTIVCIRGYTLPLLTGLSLPIVLWNGMLVYGLAYALWAKALDIGNSALISNLAYLTPAGSLMWIRLLLKQAIMPTAVLGLALILSGIVIQIYGVYRTK